MRQENRLSSLQMSVAGKHDLLIGFREIEQGPLRVAQRIVQSIDLVAQPETQISCDLIVPAAARVQLAAGVANHLRPAELQQTNAHLPTVAHRNSSDSFFRLRRFG